MSGTVEAERYATETITNEPDRHVLAVLYTDADLTVIVNGLQNEHVGTCLNLNDVEDLSVFNDRDVSLTDDEYDRLKAWLREVLD